MTEKKMGIGSRIKLLQVSFGVITLRGIDAGRSQREAEEGARRKIRSTILSNRSRLEPWEQKRILDILPFFLFDPTMHDRLCQQELLSAKRVIEKRKERLKHLTILIIGLDMQCQLSSQEVPLTVQRSRQALRRVLEKRKKREQEKAQRGLYVIESYAKRASVYLRGLNTEQKPLLGEAAA